MRPPQGELSSGSADVRTVADCDIPAVVVHIQLPEDKQKNQHVKEEHRRKIQAPEERDAAHKAHEERRIAERCQAASHVGDQKDEEYHDVPLSPAPGIDLDDGAQHQHGGAGGADDTGEQSADDEQREIHCGRTGKISGKSNVSGDAEQPEEHDDKGKIVIQNALEHDFRCALCPEQKGEGNHEQQ